MKNTDLIVGALAVLGAFTISAQDIDPNTVPANLRTSFEQTYPTANDIEWEMEGTAYKVEFEMDRKDHEIWYAPDGNIVKKEQELTEADLPQAIKTAITNTYAGYKVSDAEMTTQNGTSTYEVELKKGWNDEKEIVFNDGGKVLLENND